MTFWHTVYSFLQLENNLHYVGQIPSNEVILLFSSSNVNFFSVCT
jgi:hypothetical protein